MSEEIQAQDEQQPKRRWRVSRRGFLIGAGAVAGGVALGALVGLPALRLQLAEVVDSGGGGFGGQTNDPLLWFEVNPDNSITLYVPKVEMGQGVHTALKQIAVEELGVPWESITVQQATTAVGPQDSSGTSGSTSVSACYTPLRQAAAALREMLRVEAAAQLGAPVAELMIDGTTFVTTGGAVTHLRRSRGRQERRLGSARRRSAAADRGGEPHRRPIAAAQRHPRQGDGRRPFTASMPACRA